MNQKKIVRILSLSLAVVLLMTLTISITSAQDEVVLVIAWEQEPPNLAAINSMQWASYPTDVCSQSVGLG